MQTLIDRIRDQQDAARAEIDAPEPPPPGLTLLEQWEAFGAQCHVFLRAQWKLAAFEWHVLAGGKLVGSGGTVGRNGPNGARAQAENAARIRWENERERQRAAAEGQGEGF